MTTETTTLQLRTDLAIGLRRAVVGDIPDIARVYEHAVLNSTATFDTEVRTEDQWKHWLLEHHGDTHPVWIVTLNEQMVGWCSLSPPYRYAALHYNAEPMVYLAPAGQRKGLGPALLMFLEDEARRLGYHNLLCRVCAELKVVIRLLERVGFKRVGLIEQGARKFDRWLDVVVLQKLLE